MAGLARVERTGNQDIDGLLLGSKWDSGLFSYSFPASAAFYESGYEGKEPEHNFAPATAAQAAAARKILAMVAGVANLGFAEVQESATVHADLRFARADGAAPAWAYLPEDGAEGGDSWYAHSGGWTDHPRAGNYAFFTFIHEIGHVLGLKHGHEADGFGAMTAARDSMEFSAMTYRSHVGAAGAVTENEPWGYPQTLMMYDIAALQHLYGANYATNAGDTTYRWDPKTGQAFVDGAGQGAPGANRVFMTVWDGGGRDTYDLSNYGKGVDVDLRPGGWSTVSDDQTANLGGFFHWARGNIANALLHQGDPRSLIENATGGKGDDRLTGNAAANVLRGGGGDDRLNGLQGADTLVGGAGNDTYVVDDAFDFILEAGPGQDTVLAGASYRLGAKAAVETLKAQAPSSRAALDLSGNAFANKIVGNAGDNKLAGKGGADALTGKAGKDAFVFDVKPGAGNVDRITDFSVRDDAIHLENAVFRGVGKAGWLRKDFFAVGSQARDGNDHVVYDKAAGALLYDPDGSGPGAAVRFATLSKDLRLTHKDFFVV